MSNTIRIFKPTRPNETEVEKWIYSKSKGLRVIYKDGLECKSGWTLRELTTAQAFRGDGLPCVEVK